MVMMYTGAPSSGPKRCPTHQVGAPSGGTKGAHQEGHTKRGHAMVPSGGLLLKRARPSKTLYSYQCCGGGIKYPIKLKFDTEMEIRLHNAKRDPAFVGFFSRGSVTSKGTSVHRAHDSQHHHRRQDLQGLFGIGADPSGQP